MKNFVLALMRIKDDFINQKLMMMLYAVGSVICISVFMYFFVTIPGLVEEYKELLESPYNRTYNISLSEKSEFSASDFDFLKDYDVQNIGLQTQNEDHQSFLAVSSAEYLEQIELASKETIDKLLSDGNYIIILNNENASLPKIKNINGVDFEVIGGFSSGNLGLYDTHSAGYISLDAFIKNKLKANSISIMLTSSLSSYDNSKLIALLSQKLGQKHPVSSITDPLLSDPTEYKRGEIMNQIIKISTLYIICFIACAYLFKYVFDSNRYENTIYSLVGASKLRVVKIMLIEALILSIASFIVSTIINLLIFGTETYGILDYLAIAVFTSVLSILTIIPFFVVYIRNPLVKTKSEYV